MPYILRDTQGKITALFGQADPTHGVTEELPPDNPEVNQFLDGVGESAEAMQELTVSDADMARVTEDLVYALISKGVLLFTDLPAPARRKLMVRRRLRDQLNPLAGMIHADEIDIM